MVTVARKTDDIFEVLLKDVGPNKISVIKEVRAAAIPDLKSAKDILDIVPQILKTDLSQAEAEEFQASLAAVGATAEVRLVTSRNTLDDVRQRAARKAETAFVEWQGTVDSLLAEFIGDMLNFFSKTLEIEVNCYKEKLLGCGVDAALLPDVEVTTTRQRAERSVSLTIAFRGPARKAQKPYRA